MGSVVKEKYKKKKRLILGRKVMKNLDKALKGKDNYVTTKMRKVKVSFCSSENVWPGKTGHWGKSNRKIDVFELRIWRSLWIVPWTAKESINQPQPQTQYKWTSPLRWRSASKSSHALGMWCIRWWINKWFDLARLKEVEKDAITGLSLDQS